jgi:chemosensory pili system protein ChpA (sensor histidine kinase/response regulator)
MADTTDLDLGPLSWVKGEIDLALGRAHEALGKFTENPGDSAQLKFARTHLHQAHGALSIVGLDGITQFSETVELLLSDIEDGRAAATPAAGELAQRAVTAIRHYLDELAGGMPNQPLKLMTIYRDLHGHARCRTGRRATCFSRIFPCDRPGGRKSRPLAATEVASRLKAERARFERGFLRWLRNAEDVSGGSRNARGRGRHRGHPGAARRTRLLVDHDCAARCPGGATGAASISRSRNSAPASTCRCAVCWKAPRRWPSG